MILDADTLWVVARDQAEPVRRALDDLRKDWRKVLGHMPVTVDSFPSSWRGSFVEFGGNAENAEKENSAPEAESFILRHRRDANGRDGLILSGVGKRGLIYAIYAFAEKILGVNPWYYWVDKEPAHQRSILIADGYVEMSAPPAFRYRGWFLNDEDLLAGFAPDPLRENVMSLEMYDRIYETILRLRGNMVVPATFPFPDERCHELAARRGLVLNTHHILPLGLNTYRWPADVPYSYSKAPEVMEGYWRTCIAAFKDCEMVWTVGYRGKHDHAFWSDEPGFDTSEKRGAEISRIIRRQVELIREVQPYATMIANLWSEGAGLFRDGYLKIPEGVMVVWPDNGAGRILDQGLVGPGHGIYYHTAMLGASENQLTEMVAPARIEAEIGRFIAARATGFLLLNVSDIRPVPLTTDCVMKLAWEGSVAMSPVEKDPGMAFLRGWCHECLDPGDPQMAAEVYARFFAILQELSSEIGEFDRDGAGEKFVYTQFHKLHRLMAGEKDEDDELVQRCRVLARTAGRFYKLFAVLLWEAKRLAINIPHERRAFYRGHLLTQVNVHRLSFKMLASYARSLIAREQGEKRRAREHAGHALGAVDMLFSVLRKAEYGKWTGWYAGEGFVGLERTRDRIRILLADLDGEAPPPSRHEEGLQWWNPDVYERMYAYQKPLANNFPLFFGKCLQGKD